MKNLIIAALIIVNISLIYLLTTQDETTEIDQLNIQQENHLATKSEIAPKLTLNTQTVGPVVKIDDKSVTETSEATHQVTAKVSTAIDAPQLTKQALCDTASKAGFCQLKEDINLTKASLSEDMTKMQISAAHDLLRTNNSQMLIERLKSESLDSISFQFEQEIVAATNEASSMVGNVYLENSGCSEHICFSVFSHDNEEDWQAYSAELGGSFGTTTQATYLNAETGIYETRIVSAPRTDGIQL